MAAYTDQPPRPRRFIKVYLATWALVAIGALGYLSHLALQPSHGTQTRTQAAEPDPSQAMRALAKTTVEMGAMRRSLGDIQNDVAILKEAATEREAKDKVVTGRLAAVEERLATIPTTAEQTEAPSKTRADKSQRRNADPKVSARMINVPPDPPAPATAPVAPSFRDDGPPIPLETGSISSKEAITFGEPVVTRAGPIAFAVQLAAGPSLQGLKQSWGQLRERHGALSALEPRVVAPRSDGGPYRLLAGPFATKADADRVCTEMGVGRNGCYVTTYIGAPL
jgi:SPOR domain